MVTPVDATVAERKEREPNPVSKSLDTSARDLYEDFILDNCVVCNEPAEGYLCHGFKYNNGQISRVPVLQDSGCPLCKREGHPVCSPCYHNGGAIGLIDRWLIE